MLAGKKESRLRRVGDHPSKNCQEKISHSDRTWGVKSRQDYGIQKLQRRSHQLTPIQQSEIMETEKGLSVPRGGKGAVQRAEGLKGGIHRP